MGITVSPVSDGPGLDGHIQRDRNAPFLAHAILEPECIGMSLIKHPPGILRHKVKPHTNGSKIPFERLEASSRGPKMQGRLQSDQCVRVLVSTKRKNHALSHPNI